MARMLRYAIDTVNSQRISGWCYSGIFKQKPLTLEIYSGERLIGDVVSNEFRQDLIDLAVHPTGRCGFDYYFPEGFKVNPAEPIKICTKERFSRLIGRYSYNEIAQVSIEKLPHIIFMHIPKTAGTSFNTYASQFFPANKSITHIEAVPDNRAALAQQYNYIAGHLSFGKLVALYPPVNFKYYSIVRNPIRHLHSHLNWVRGIGVDQTCGFFKKHPYVIQELAVKLNSRKMNIKDILYSFVQNLDGFEVDFFDNIQTRYFLDYRPERVTSDDISSAINNCAIFKNIGLTESYMEFTRAFCAENEFSHIEQPKPLNRSNHKPLYDIQSAEIKEIIFPLVREDLALYDYVTNIKPGNDGL